jgi:2-octaprenyl-6-methoxyphenol hydroxylase
MPKMTLSPAISPDPLRFVDVLIAGGGIVGLALAAGIKTVVGAAMRVEVWDPALGRLSPPLRVSALAPSSRRMLERLDVWTEIAPCAQPVVGMDITDSRLADVVRPRLLTFEEPRRGGDPLAHIVANAAVEDALMRRARALGVSFRQRAVGKPILQRDIIAVAMEGGAPMRARLLVAADGMRSPLRDFMAIETVGWSYDAEALVCTVAHERDHEGRARQHFLPEGPFAILPLRGRNSSIVWSAPKALARTLARMSPEAFKEQLSIRFGHELGDIDIVNRPLRFELRMQVARRFATPRFALVGDAAHVVHPLAGQGLNLGLRDAAALAEVIIDRSRLGLDPGAIDALRDYETARRFDTVAMAAANDVLHRLFAAEGLARPARDWGLGLVDRSGALKSGLMREAAGFEDAQPTRATR